jgi:hypothetical protein
MVLISGFSFIDIKIFMKEMIHYAVQDPMTQRQSQFLSSAPRPQSPLLKSGGELDTEAQYDDHDDDGSLDGRSVEAVIPSSLSLSRPSAEMDSESTNLRGEPKRVDSSNTGGRRRPTPPVPASDGPFLTLDDDPFRADSFRLYDGDGPDNSLMMGFLPVRQESRPTMASMSPSPSDIDRDFGYYSSSGQTGLSRLNRYAIYGSEQWQVERRGLRAEIQQLRSECARLENIAGPPPAYDIDISR